jgi:hypothetical protein
VIANGESEGDVSDTITAGPRGSSREKSKAKSVSKEPVKKGWSIWDEIDAYELDVEEVSIWERSSDLDAR